MYIFLNLYVNFLYMLEVVKVADCSCESIQHVRVLHNTVRLVSLYLYYSFGELTHYSGVLLLLLLFGLTHLSESSWFSGSLLILYIFKDYFCRGGFEHNWNVMNRNEGSQYQSQYRMSHHVKTSKTRYELEVTFMDTQHIAQEIYSWCGHYHEQYEQWYYLVQPFQYRIKCITYRNLHQTDKFSALMTWFCIKWKILVCGEHVDANRQTSKTSRYQIG